MSRKINIIMQKMSRDINMYYYAKKCLEILTCTIMQEKYLVILTCTIINCAMYFEK